MTERKMRDASAGSSQGTAGSGGTYGRGVGRLPR